MPLCRGSAAGGQAASGQAQVMIQLPLAVAITGSVLWLVVVINAVNFMDGANGLAMGMAAIAALGFAICAGFIGAWTLALLSISVAGALAGFLVWNIPGKLFVGDAGAYFTGAILGGLSLEFVRQRPDLLFVPPMLLLPFLSDVLMTLAWRSMHGKKLFVAHRDHTYQIAMKAGLRHWQVALVHAFWALNAAVVGVASTILGGHMPAIAFGALLLVSDQPMIPEGVKTEASDAKVSADYVRNHIKVGIESLKLIRRHGKSVRHLRFDE